MNACHGYWWCHSCDEPALSSCRQSKKHRVEFVLDAPVRDVTVLAQKHQAAHTHQFTPIKAERAQNLFAEIRAKIG